MSYSACVILHFQNGMDHGHSCNGCESTNFPSKSTRARCFLLGLVRIPLFLNSMIGWWLLVLRVDGSMRACALVRRCWEWKMDSYAEDAGFDGILGSKNAIGSLGCSGGR
ncbi:hypothetical protein DL98DRAFT_159236 [Cadophora sp. DSE1049]|nr:hypothetical protein DL98DRAFT_159236 [Cadophora sp. DSE1049]